MKIAVLVSGGVDSSVALARVVEQEPQAEVHAFYLKIWLEDELAHLGHCPWEEDLRYVRAITEQLAVPLEVISLQTAYHERVVAHALEELTAGRTPSPDLLCNARVKFGAFLDAIGDDYDFVATGHYARVDRTGDRSRLLTAVDSVKDQTYFLARLRQHQLERALFPLAPLTKPTVRALAADMGLATQSRKDSQGICFLGKIPYPDFVRHHLGTAPGDIADIDSGDVLGRHEGLWFHTIGQRRGLGLGGGPWFVVGKDHDTRTLLVAHADRFTPHHRSDFRVSDLHWFSAPDGTEPLEVKLRHGPRKTRCSIESDTGSTLQVHLHAPDPGVAPGQFAVFYRHNECIGSGVIG